MLFRSMHYPLPQSNPPTMQPPSPQSGIPPNTGFRGFRPVTSNTNASVTGPSRWNGKPVDIKDMPTFVTPQRSLVWYTNYKDPFLRWLAPLELALKDQHELQLNILKGSFGGVTTFGLSFLRLHRDEFLNLCHSDVGFYLDNMLHADGPSGLSSSHAREASNFAHDVRVAQHTIRNAPDVLRPAGRQAQQAIKQLPAGSYQVLRAWLLLVEVYYCVPQENEVQVWMAGMHQGVPNLLNPKVAPEESPEEFGERVLHAYQLFNNYKFDSAVGRAINARSSLDVFLEGIKPDFQHSIEWGAGFPSY